MIVHRSVTPNIKFSDTHLYACVERGTVRVKCLAQEHRLDPETSALTMRSPSHIKPEFRNLQVSGTFDASSTDISSTDISSTDISEPVLHSSLSSLKFFQGQSEIIKFSDFTIRHSYSLCSSNFSHRNQVS